MRKYVFAIILALCLIAALLPGTPAAADDHGTNHTCLCGAENCSQTGTGHGEIPSDKWEGIGNDEFESEIETDKVEIGAAGQTRCYYLTEDINCYSGRYGVKFVGNVILCLNGHNIKFSGGQDRLSITDAAATLTICDCGRETGNVDVEVNGKNYSYTYFGGAIRGIKLDISNGTVNLYNCTITGYHNNQNVIDISTDAILNMYDGASVLGNGSYQAGAVKVNGQFNMYGGLIAGNHWLTGDPTSGGGGVLVGWASSIATFQGTFNMYGGTIQDNMADNGGGVYVTAGSVFNMHGGTIRNNSTHGGGWQNHGGGVLVEGSTFNMYGGTITGNQTGTGNGGGIAMRGSGGVTTISGGAIISDNTSFGYGGGIFVKSGNTLNIQPGNGKINITGNKALDNEGHRTGNGGGMYLENLANGTLTLDQVIISNNTAHGCGGGIYANCNVNMKDGASITGNGANSGEYLAGGGVYLAGGTFDLNGGEISNNKDDILNGAGVYVAGGTFNLNSGKINGNEAQSYGGGVYVAGGTFNLNGGEINNNEASFAGGMNYEGGTVTINEGSTISGNTATRGAGIMVSGDNITMSGGSITGNRTKGNQYKEGGGVCIVQYTNQTTDKYYSGVFTMTGGSITGNTAGSHGAGVYFLNGGTFKVSGDANVTGNTVGNSANNVYLNNINGVLTITGPLNGATFGITANADTPFTSGWSTNMSGSDPTQFFTSDLDNRYVTLSENEVELRNGYQIKYELNGGQFVDEYTPVYSYVSGNQDVQLPGADKITRNGYTFGGWYDNEGLTGKPYTVIPSDSTGPKTFYAKWMANTYTVEFEPNGGTINSGNVTNYTYGQGAVLPTNVEKSGYTFDGWYSDPDYNSGPYTNIGADETGDKTYYAKWTSKTYSITFNTNGGTIKGSKVEEYKYGEGAQLPTNVEKTGYTFGGWYEDDQFTGDAVISISATDSGDKTFYAKWTANTYTVAFDANGGDGGSMDDQTFIYDTAQNLTANTFTRTGYTFAGWSEDKDGSVVYTDGQSVKNLTSEQNGSVTLYAKWTANTYTVTFDANGGEGSMETQTFTYDQTQTLSRNAFTRTGYTFAGWNTAKDGSGTAYANQADGSRIPAQNGAVTLYAQWKANSYSVTLNLNGGKFVEGYQGVTSYTYGTTTLLPDAEQMTRSGYRFEGWYADKTFKDGPYTEISNTDVGDKTFYARWTMYNIPETHEIIVIDPANGTVKVNPSNGSVTTLITVTATPDEGYELAYITVDGEKITGSTFRMPDHDVTVSAVFVSESFPFVDVKSGDWFYDYVAYVYANGLMDGTSATTFEPNANMTRAMVWAILARIDGETVTGANWIDTARAWAMAEGVSDGTDPNGLVTREQFVTMLYRYALAKGYDVSIGESTNILSYADFDKISEWAIPAMQWGCGSGVITGVTESTLEPAGTATRAQGAAMLMRFVEGVK